MNKNVWVRSHWLQKISFAAITLLSLSACLSLPEGPGDPSRHYGLLPAKSSCSATSPSTLKLAITRVASGLEGDRITQLSGRSGEMVFIGNMRWASNTQMLLEQRLAQDLETAGFTVITSHHKLAATRELNCELRALNLWEDGSAAYDTLDKTTVRQAHFGLSCALYDPIAQSSRVIIAEGSSHLEQLRADEIAKALSESYHQGFTNLCIGLTSTGT